MRSFTTKCTQMHVSAGLCPDPLGELTALPSDLLDRRGWTVAGRGEEGERRKERGKGKWGKQANGMGEGRGDERDWSPPTFETWLCSCLIVSYVSYHTTRYDTITRTFWQLPNWTTVRITQRVASCISMSVVQEAPYEPHSYLVEPLAAAISRRRLHKP